MINYEKETPPYEHKKSHVIPQSGRHWECLISHQITSQTTTTMFSASTSSLACAQWFRKQRKYILVSLGAGLILAVILALRLTQTTASPTTTEG